MNDVGLTPYLLVAAVLFVCGIVCMASKRNGIGVLMGVTAVVLAFFARFIFKLVKRSREAVQWTPS